MQTARRIPSRARTLAVAGCAALTLTLSACGGDSDDSTGTDDSSVPTETIEALTMTYGEFSPLPQDEKEKVLREALASTPACDDNEYSYDLLLIVSSDAAMKDPERTIGDRIEEACTP